MAYVYKIENIINKKLYIGSTINYKRRWCSHIYDLKNNIHNNTYLQNAWNKYGENNFEFKVIEECNDDEQYIREQYYLDTLQPFGINGYNISKNATGGNSNIYNTDYELIMKIKILMKKGLSDKEIVKITEKSEAVIRNIRDLRTFKYIYPCLNIFLNNRTKLRTINNNSLIRFGISLNELKEKKNRTQEEIDFLTDVDLYLNNYKYRLDRINKD